MQQKIKIQKPVGIYVIAIAVFIITGIFQLLRYWIEIQRADEDLPFLIVFIPLFLSAFTAFSAIWVCFGDNWSRVSLLMFVSLNVLWWAFIVIHSIAYDESKTFKSFPLITTLVRPIFILVICWWYFNKKEVVAFYKQNI